MKTKTGKNSDGQLWSEAYDYHLGAVNNPLPFEVFRRKYELLASMLRLDPGGKQRSLDARILSLSLELGY